MLVGLQLHTVLLDPRRSTVYRHPAQLLLSAQHHPGAGGEASPEPHQRRRAGAQGRPGGHCPAAASGHYESFKYDGGATAGLGVDVCAVVVHNAYPYVIPGIFYCVNLLFSKRRGKN